MIKKNKQHQQPVCTEITQERITTFGISNVHMHESKQINGLGKFVPLVAGFAHKKNPSTQRPNATECRATLSELLGHNLRNAV